MLINNTIFQVELIEILTELQRQLQINKILLLQVIKDSGNDLMVQCPYHSQGQEKRPSAGIRKSDGMFHCFACGEVHTLQEVISHCFGHSDDLIGSWGWKWLVKNFATIAIEERKDIVLDMDRSKKKEKTPVYVTEEELKQYRWIHNYMYFRGLTDEVIELFDVGFDAKTKCITFPVRDKEGNCLFVARRSVRTKYFNYPEGVEKPLYGLYELYQQEQFPDEVIICESMLDALSCWVYGKYAAALNGLGNDLQFKQLRKLPCRKLILATDNDERGMEARERITNNVTNKIITEYAIPRLIRSNGSVTKDINDLTKEEFDNLQEIF